VVDVYEQPTRINCCIWLDASQRSRDGVWVNRSVSEVKCKALWTVLRTGYCLFCLLVTSKLDFGNAVLRGINGRLLQKLQRVQYSAARVITQQRRRDHLHITPVLITLHYQDIGFNLPTDTRPSARIHRWHDHGIYAGSPVSLRRKPSPESTTPQFRTLWSAWLFSDGSAPVERYTGQSATNRLTWTF